MEELPVPVARVCGSFVHALQNSAEGLLDGLYLRGSLAWGESFPGSDIDFTAVLSRRPSEDDLAVLEAAHTQLWFEFPDFTFDGHHLLLDDLQASPTLCPPVPVSHAGRFVPDGDLDVNPVTWCELAERGIRLVGREPGALGIRDDHDELLRFTAENLAGYWARRATQLKLGWLAAGRSDEAVVWCALGVARLHHLLATGAVTSKSGAAQYVLTSLDERWHPLATDALRAREHPELPSSYRSLSQRGRDLRDFVAWCVKDGAQLAAAPGGADG